MAQSSKKTMITLNCPSLGDVQFEVSHAERILQMPNSGWELPEDSEFELKDGSITPRDTRKDKKA